MHIICLILSVCLNCVVNYEINLLSSNKWTHPYSLHYDIRTNYLYFSDLLNASIHCYDLNNNEYYDAVIENGAAPSFIIPVRGEQNRYLISDKLTTSIIEWDGIESTARIISNEFTVENEKIYAQNNWNIAKASPNCQYYGGTFRGNLCSGEPGSIASLYKYTKRRGVKRIVKCLKLSGGIDWNISENLFYHVDSSAKVLKEYDYDPPTGNIYSGRIVYKFEDFGDDAITPLGMTIDTKGYLYATTYFGGEVLKINPRTKKCVQRIKIPAEAVASVAFGGPNLDILFVSTDQMPFNTTVGDISSRTISPLSGSIFMVTGLNSRGYPGRKICI